MCYQVYVSKLPRPYFCSPDQESDVCTEERVLPVPLPKIDSLSKICVTGKHCKLTPIIISDTKLYPKSDKMITERLCDKSQNPTPIERAQCIRIGTLYWYPEILIITSMSVCLYMILEIPAC